MPGNRVMSFLGIVRKAGRLCIGMDAVKESIHNGKACLLLVAEDVSKRSADRVFEMAKEKGVPSRIIRVSMAELSAAIGRKAGIVTVIDQGFAKRLLELLGERAEKSKEAMNLEKCSKCGEEYVI